MTPSLAPIVVVGALHVDELYWPTAELVPRASNPMQRTRSVGGVGANVARAARRSGAYPLTMVAALGDDADAIWLRDTLSNEKISLSAHTAVDHPSGRYIVVHDENGELYVGLSDTAVAEQLDGSAVLAQLNDSDTSPAAVVIDANLSASCVAEVVAGVQTWTGTPCLALAVSPQKALRLLPVLGSLGLLFCNRREAAALTDLKSDAALSDLADALKARGCQRFVLSDGAAPVLVQDAEARHWLEVPPVQHTRSVNGAGDALAGATLVNWLAGNTLDLAVRDAGLPAAAAHISSSTLT